MKTPLLIAATAALLASCAGGPATQATDERVYTTGSNIPKRERNVQTMTPEAFEQLRSAGANAGKPKFD